MPNVQTMTVYSLMSTCVCLLVHAWGAHDLMGAPRVYLDVQCHEDDLVHVQVLEKCPTCGPALAFLAESCSAQKLLLTQRGNQKLAEAATAEGVRLYRALEVTDPMRAAYWQLCQANLLNVP